MKQDQEASSGESSSEEAEESSGEEESEYSVDIRD